MKNQAKRLLQQLPLSYVVARSFFGLTRSIRRFATYSSCLENGSLVQFDNRFRHNFCGYYDHSPFLSDNESLILVHSTNASILKNPDPKCVVCARLIDWTTGHEVERLGESYAWNWQQGSRLMWISGRKWIFNIFDKDRSEYGSVIGEVGSTKRMYLPYPVQEISPLGVFYSISYSALAAIRPDYGYFNREIKQSDFELNCLLEVELTGASRTIVSAEFLRSETENRLKERIFRYKINHVLCAPNGKQIVFMFRYFVQDGRRVTDVYLYKRDFGTVTLIVPDSAVSHYCWLDSKHLMYTGIHESQFGYYVFDDLGNKIGPVLGVGRDGHPVALKDGSVITDTYPDHLGIRSLFRFALGKSGLNKSYAVLARFVEPWYLWGQRRCDLHPSVSPSQQYWQVDVVSRGRRGVWIGEV